MNANILSHNSNAAWPADLSVTGTYFGKPFAGRIMDDDCRWIGGTFIFRVETTKVSPEFASEYGSHRLLDFYVGAESNSRGHSLEWTAS